MPVRKVSPDRARRVRELHAAGRTVAEIAAEVGMSDTTVGDWHKLLGLAPNRAPTRHEAFWTPEKLEQGKRLAAEVGINTAAARALGIGVNGFTAKAEAEGWPRRVLRPRRDAAPQAPDPPGDR